MVVVPDAASCACWILKMPETVTTSTPFSMIHVQLVPSRPYAVLAVIVPAVSAAAANLGIEAVSTVPVTPDDGPAPPRTAVVVVPKNAQATLMSPACGPDASRPISISQVPA